LGTPPSNEWQFVANQELAHARIQLDPFDKGGQHATHLDPIKVEVLVNHLGPTFARASLGSKRGHLA